MTIAKVFAALKLRVYLFFHVVLYYPSYRTAFRAFVNNKYFKTDFEVMDIESVLSCEDCDELLAQAPDENARVTADARNYLSVPSIKHVPHVTVQCIKDALTKMVEPIVPFPLECFEEPELRSLPSREFVYDSCYNEHYNFTMEKGVPPKFATLVVYLDDGITTHFPFAGITKTMKKGSGILYLHMDTNLTLCPESIRYDIGPGRIVTIKVNLWQDRPEWKERLTQHLTEARTAHIDPFYLETIFLDPKYIHNTKVTEAKKDI